jgi:hypothetical protein
VRLYLERARDREDGSETARCTDFCQGGAPGQGVVVEGFKGCKQAPSLQKFAKTATKTGGFLHFLALKSLNFHSKVLNKMYTPKMFFEEYINLNIFFVT